MSGRPSVPSPPSFACRYLLFLPFLVPCVLPSLTGQVDPDSLQSVRNDSRQPDSVRWKAINAGYPRRSYPRPDSSLQVIRLHLELAGRRNNLGETAKAYNGWALIHYVKGRPDSMLACLFRALDIRREMKDTLGLASLYNNIGSAYRSRNNYREAVKYYTTSLGLFKENGQNSAYQAAVLNNLGLVYPVFRTSTLQNDQLQNIDILFFWS